MKRNLQLKANGKHSLQLDVMNICNFVLATSCVKKVEVNILQRISGLILAILSPEIFQVLKTKMSFSITPKNLILLIIKGLRALYMFGVNLYLAVVYCRLRQNVNKDVGKDS